MELPVAAAEECAAVFLTMDDWAREEDEEPDAPAAGNGNARSFWLLALTGLATSIDAAAIGVGLAFLDVHIGIVAAVIFVALKVIGVALLPVAVMVCE